MVRSVVVCIEGVWGYRIFISSYCLVMVGGISCVLLGTYICFWCYMYGGILVYIKIILVFDIRYRRLLNYIVFK